MSTLWIREYTSEPTQAGGIGIPVAREPGTDQTPVTYSTSAQSTAFGAETKFIAIASDAAFHYVMGSNPTATTSHMYCPATTILYVGVIPGQKLAVVAA